MVPQTRSGVFGSKTELLGGTVGSHARSFLYKAKTLAGLGLLVVISVFLSWVGSRFNFRLSETIPGVSDSCFSPLMMKNRGK